MNGNTMPTTPQKPVNIKTGKAAAPMITVLTDSLQVITKQLYNNSNKNYLNKFDSNMNFTLILF